MKAAMGRLMAGVSRLMGGLGGGLGKWIMKPGEMITVMGKQVWKAGEWTLDKAADIVDYGIEMVDTGVGVAAQAAIHVGQDIGKGAMFTAGAAKHVGQDVIAGAGIATSTLGKLAWNNPVSKVARKVGRFMIEDNRPVINSDKGAKAAADKSMQSAKDMNPAELAKVKAEYIDKDPKLIFDYVKAKTSKERETALTEMSPAARAWVENLQPTDLWSLKGKQPVEIAAHLAGDKLLPGVAKIESYYTPAPKAVEEASKAEVPKDKTVTERRAERTAKKLAKREASNGGPQTVAGTVPKQAPQQDSAAQQQIMAFFGPRVADEDEISPYASATQPTPRPPVPMRRANG